MRPGSRRTTFSRTHPAAGSLHAHVVLSRLFSSERLAEVPVLCDQIGSDRTLRFHPPLPDLVGTVPLYSRGSVSGVGDVPRHLRESPIYELGVSDDSAIIQRIQLSIIARAPFLSLLLKCCLCVPENAVKLGGGGSCAFALTAEQD